MRKFLFIHQNFPGQFVHVAAELARLGHEVVALGIGGPGIPGNTSVRYIRYPVKPPERPSDVPLLREFEGKLVRGLACTQAMVQLKVEGFVPDVVVAHPGWGEALFCKDVWPTVKMVMFAEFFYSAENSDFDFDPEFPMERIDARLKLRMKNTEHLHALLAADAIYAPTRWQRDRLPPEYHHKTDVIFDGIDTAQVVPDAAARITLQRQNITAGPDDEIITFVNRNLEPYRGFHVFMRALPEILKQRPKARCVIVGRDAVSYGSAPSGGGAWREVMLKEMGDRLPLDRVHFLGGLAYADYLKVIQVSACHVYLTYPFVLSWSCLEAMSAERVVVGSRTGPVTEVIEHGVNGLLVDFFDIGALAAQVVQVLAEPARFRALGVQARKTVMERYDLRSVCLPALVQRLLSV